MDKNAEPPIDDYDKLKCAAWALVNIMVYNTPKEDIENARVNLKKVLEEYAQKRYAAREKEFQVSLTGYTKEKT